MKNGFNALLIITALACSCNAATDFQTEDFTLTDGWKIHASGSDVKYDASVPSTVLGTLTAHGLYADAFVGTNYDKVINRDDFAEPWVYETEFTLPQLKEGQRVELDFEGISYCGEATLNGMSLGVMEGPYRQFSFDVTDMVREHNTLQVQLVRADKGDFNIGFVDWNPRAADESMGIFRPVWVRFSNAVSVKNTAVRSKVDTKTLDKAWLTVETTLRNSSQATVKGQIVVSMEGRRFKYPVKLEAGEEKTVTLDSKDNGMLKIRNPRLWWCHNLGSPEMYHMDVAFVCDGVESDSQGVDFGIRQIDSYFTEKGHRGFLLNGKKVLIKGAGWTDDIFLRNPDSRNDQELDYVKDMNMNAVRFENVWGTSQNVYDLCDRKGILALVGWSCFWEWEVYSGVPNDQFGCIKSEEDMDLIAASLKDQVLWLRNHPSIIAWYVGSDDLPRPALEQRYLDILPSIDDRPYVAAAKALVSEVSGPTGMKMVGPYDYQGPEYWYNPVAPGGAFGFNTETGIGAQLPMKESLMKMIPQNELWPVGKAYDYHCTVAGEDMHSLDVLKKVMDARYSTPQNLDEFLLRAHHIDYDGTRAMFEAFRVNTPRTTGIIQWMLNSAWPSVYWQMYDWYLNPVASYYSVKKALAPQQLVFNYYDKGIYAVNDEAAACVLNAKVEIFDLEGKCIMAKEDEVNMAEGCSVKLFDVPAVKDVAFMFLSLTDGQGVQVSDNNYLLSEVDDVHDWANYNWIRTRLTRHSDYSALDRLAQAAVRTECTRAEDKLEVTLANTSDAVAFFVRLALKDSAGELVNPAFWSDNMVSLKPGETRTYTCSGAELNGCHIQISGWNVKEERINL